jgi:hypothetical protein
MSTHTDPSEQRITLAAMKELDRLAWQFRRKLRDCAVELTQEATEAQTVTPEMVREAAPLACQALLSDLESPRNHQGDSDAERRDAA